MFDDYYNSPNGFTVHRYNENENVNESEIKVRGTTIFQNPEQYYPDYEKYKEQGMTKSQQWEEETKESQDKLNELKRTAEVSGTVINQNDGNDVVDPNAFFGNNSQVYVLFNLGDKLKGK